MATPSITHATQHSPVRHISIPGSSAANAVRHAELEGFVDLDGIEMYRVPNVGQIPPFLMTLSSESDLWMYISSTGGLTAGRIKPGHALFPYETEDRLHRLYAVTGPITLLRVQVNPSDRAAPAVLWEPFSPFISTSAAGSSASQDPPVVLRNLYRNALGTRLVFEEHHRALGLTFRYAWCATDAHGFVRTATLVNTATHHTHIEVLDGLLNLLPAGVTPSLTQNLSCLVDAYKQSEVDPTTSLAVYSLTSPIGDKPEAGEVMRANTVWHTGLSDATVLLTEDALATFRHSLPLEPHQARTVSGKRGAYLLHVHLKLAPGKSAHWHIVADVEQSHSDLARTHQLLTSATDLPAVLALAMATTDTGLRRNLALVDGLQSGRDTATTAHHGLNVLFNNMRGGVPLDHYTVHTHDFSNFLQARNAPAGASARSTLATFPPTLPAHRLIDLAATTSQPDLTRLALEYLPLNFSRRHGDPSRPWNQFAIHIRNPDGSPRVGYQGNWRDIFQNWESLALSYPEFLPQFIAKFLNASTADGYNPYRVTSDGIEWEVEEPNEPWSHLGYWGDHQIVYLLRLLELSRDFSPGWLTQWLDRPVFSFANVPYFLKPHAEICQNPRQSIRFDHDRDSEIRHRVDRLGTDGRLVIDPTGAVHHTTLLEKLLIPLLSKLCNLVPNGGIWLNTQRPEWNDANNALAGFGLSVVTLGYMRRYVEFLTTLLASATTPEISVSADLVHWIRDLTSILAHQPKSITNEHARRLLDELSLSFERYRLPVYERGFKGQQALPIADFQHLLSLAHATITASLQANLRPDGLFHSYNILGLPSPQTLTVSHLSEMLEGQVSILSSGLLTSERSLALLESLYHSKLYRPDIHSFILYPNRTLPAFKDRNRIPAESVLQSPLLRELVAAGDPTVVCLDAAGDYRFAPGLTSAVELATALDRLTINVRWTPLVATHRLAVLDLYEHLFQHARFTGRSGSMHAYEGLGSVYWHMIGKLLVAAQECFWHEADTQNRPDLLRPLAAVYYRIREGLGFAKTAKAYGAVPIEPYSHTPFGGGARQPGMTGQVKEEIITRRGELGVRVTGGSLQFNPRLLRRREIHQHPATFPTIDLQGRPLDLILPAGTFAFTVSQVPVIYHFAGVAAPTTVVHHAAAPPEKFFGTTLDREASNALFRRTGSITRIDVHFPSSALTLD